MFKSELIILIFLLVLLCILILNSNNFEYFTSQPDYKLTITNADHKQLIINNINGLIQLLDKIIAKRNFITNQQSEIENMIKNKIALESTQQNTVSTRNMLENSLNANVNAKQKLDNDLRVINNNIQNNSVTLSNKKKYIQALTSSLNYYNNIRRRYIYYRNVYYRYRRRSYYFYRTRYFNKIISIYDRLIAYYNYHIQNARNQLAPLENTARTLQLNKLQVSRSISEKKLEIANLTRNITTNNANITQNNEKLHKTQEQITNYEDTVKKEFIVTFSLLTDLNTELDSYNLKPISNVKVMKDFKNHTDSIINNVKNVKSDLNNILKDFEKTNKIGFGKLKTCKIKFNDIIFDNGYKEHILLSDNLSDNENPKNMYYQIPLDNLKQKTNTICKNRDNIIFDNSITQKNVNDMCDNKNYMSSCLLLYNDNKITDGTDNYITENNKCYKRIPFTKQIPYTKIKLPCII